MDEQGDAVAGDAVLEDDDEGRAEAMLRSFHRLRVEMEEVVEWLGMVRREGAPEDLPKAAELERKSKEYDRTFRVVTELEGKVADAKRIERGGDGIDLDAARAEVRRRLDLRLAARGEGGVP